MAKVAVKEQPIAKMLNKQVANFSVLYMKIHNFHWYVKGENFFTLHVKFEELYNEITLHLDAIAERMLATGSQPVATLKEQLATASIEEAKGNEDANGMVRALVADFGRVCDELSEAIEAGEKAGDEPTADLLIGIRSSLEKHGWMLSAFLGK
ncbi:DNA starvation/stationary phase protection protein [Paenibacillus athensensis]|uniref:DNA starvation/stationary phase protection protein n=1 Tax=Paenibacillus athensensis TaxID=1967502 RepID=A0A4Y8PZT5_9BACL|nr:DNA starvation/stationary phase protection protein [Paenibacillus athensensis]MCD1261207.1 DNA starvation/stationary phase protection protein [Paenibacillus athensensis]